MLKLSNTLCPARALKAEIVNVPGRIHIAEISVRDARIGYLPGRLGGQVGEFTIGLMRPLPP